MTRKEAKIWLNKLYTRTDISDEYGDMEDMQPYEEAIDMAMKALEQESCEDTISRQAVLDLAILEVVDIDDIKALPSVTPQPRTGQWKRMSDFPNDVDDRFECSRCGNVVHHNNVMDLRTFSRWCGRCGSENTYKKEVEG